MTYPATLDVYTTVENGNTITAAMFNSPNDGIEKLMIEVGKDTPAAGSLRYKCDHFFIAATHIFFAQATPPTGWTIDTAHKDNVLACKSDSGDYSVIGPNKGQYGWSQPNHVHTGPSHNHRWSYNGLYTYNISGSGVAFGSYTTKSTNLMLTRGVTDGDGWYRNSEILYTNNAGSGNTGGNATINTYRPYATVGVIATYSGA